MYTNEWDAYFSYIIMDVIVGGYSVLLNPFHCCRYLMHFYHGKLQVAASHNKNILYWCCPLDQLVCCTIVKFIISLIIAIASEGYAILTMVNDAL